MKQEQTRRTLNVTIPGDVYRDLEQYSDQSGYNKTQIVIAALQQFIAIKHEEASFKESHPDSRVRSRVVLESLPREDDAPRMASVLLY